ncbi:hypothetical protein AVEN_60135-1 [Araneus ventricosus]|uniref:Tc1-like transposase DDE domain-containing protein n=1 Tax=Araneus ventricosus TaxID=182803 RepID=A0A4Y2HXG0_ARAVE|nr:hypothetical protein AVEN_60135-1 [Araneus ventricosus]
MAGRTTRLRFRTLAECDDLRYGTRLHSVRCSHIHFGDKRLSLFVVSTTIGVSSVQQYIRDTFQQQVIGYGDCVEWPPHSPDLNPLDFFLWGYIKQQVYATPTPTLQELQNRITDACASVSPAMLQMHNVQREVQSSVQMCIVAEGHHFEHDR